MALGLQNSILVESLTGASWESGETLGVGGKAWSEPPCWILSSSAARSPLGVLPDMLLTLG